MNDDFAAGDLNRDSAEPLYLQLERWLREQIDGEVLAPGDRLPGEKELAAQFGISRMTARRGVDALAAEGLLVRQAGKGTFVADSKIPFAISTLGSFSKTMQAMGFAVSSKVVDLSLTTPPPRVVAALMVLPDQPVAFLRRVRYVNEQPLALMSSYMPASYFDALAAADLTTTPLSRVMETASGLKLTTAQDYVEASVARDEEAALLQVPVGAPVLLGRGVVYESRGMPVRTSTVIYRGDRFRIGVSSSQGGAEVRVPAHETDNEQWLALRFSMAE